VPALSHQARRTCNCREKNKCPLKGNCLSEGIIYQAKVTFESKTKTCVRLTATEFRQGLETIRCRSTMKNTTTTQNLANTSGSLKANNNTTS